MDQIIPSIRLMAPKETRTARLINDGFVNVLDHIIIGESEYLSFVERGLL